MEKVFADVISRGYKEIVLTGTHIGQYDDGDGTDLEQLLERLIAVDGDYRIRLSSLDPRDCSNRILELVTEHEKVARHLHVSLQSCSREVLDAMDRPFAETEKVAERLVELREKYPALGIGADLIVGFPGESLFPGPAMDDYSRDPVIFSYPGESRAILILLIRSGPHLHGDRVIAVSYNVFYNLLSTF